MNINFRADDPLLYPVRAYPSDAGADLKSTTDAVLMPGDSVLVDTGVSVEIPEWYVGLVFSRSGQGNVRVSLANSVGVIDAQYRGTIKVRLCNDGSLPYQIVAKSTKIAQLVVMPIVLAEFDLFTGTDEEWNNTARGTAGFGSTG